MMEEIEPATFIEYVIRGDLESVRELTATCFPYRDLLDVRGKDTVSFFHKANLHTSMWNPVLFSIDFNRFRILKFFVEECDIPAPLAVVLSPYKSEFDQKDLVRPSPESRYFGLLLAVYKRCNTSLEYLLRRRPQEWALSAIFALVKGIKETLSYPQLVLVLESEAFEMNLRVFSLEEKLFVVDRLCGILQLEQSS